MEPPDADSAELPTGSIPRHIPGMVNFDEQRLEELCARHDVRVLRLFGSAARGEERPDSDVDIIVEFVRPKGFFDLQKLEDELTSLFGREVDLQTPGSISRYFRDRVLASSRVLYDRAG